MKILLAIDDSKFSDAAIEAVIHQLSPRETEVRMLHVIEPMPIYPDGQAWGYSPAASQVLDEQRKEAEGLIASAAQKLRAAGFNVTQAVEQGNPKVVILDCAAAWHPDLIVMGSHGRKGNGPFSDGKCVRSRCPSRYLLGRDRARSRSGRLTNLFSAAFFVRKRASVRPCRVARLGK